MQGAKKPIYFRYGNMIPEVLISPACINEGVEKYVISNMFEWVGPLSFHQSPGVLRL